MSRATRIRLVWALGLLLVGGCCYPVRDHVDLAVDGLANQVIDLQPVDNARPRERAERVDGSVQRAAYQQPDDQPRRLPQRLKLPSGLPGTEAPSIEIKRREEREAVLRKFYSELPALGPDPSIQPGPGGMPLTLADLQRLAMSNSPLLRQAAADVQAALGAARQAGAYPNPTMGYESDTVNTAGTAGFQGGFIDQVIKTGGKLKLSWAAAQIDLYNARLALRRAQTDLTYQVRGQYFAVLVALENIRINKALVELTDATFRLLLEDTIARGQPTNPMGLRVLAYQARVNLIQARNRYTSAWIQLAANLGLPGMPPTELAGRADMPLPIYEFGKVRDRMLSAHTDVLTADNAVRKARYQLRLAQVTPIPDVDVKVLVQKDFTAAPFLVSHGIQVTVPVPIWDQNRGGIQQAQGQLMRAIEEGHRVRDALTITLTDAFERYDTNRKTLAYYRNHILPDQVRYYTGLYEAYMTGQVAEVGFPDVVAAQQTLATALATYISTLGLMWQAVADVANVMQTNDLFQIGGEAVETECLLPLPDLDKLPELPCCHPSSPLPGPRLKGAPGGWPEAIPEPPNGKRPKMPRIENGDEQGKARRPMNPAREPSGTRVKPEVELLSVRGTETSSGPQGSAKTP
jgi:cobalt-zinc-cadmium efflux system outer membrane protein